MRSLTIDEGLTLSAGDVMSVTVKGMQFTLTVGQFDLTLSAQNNPMVAAQASFTVLSNMMIDITMEADEEGFNLSTAQAFGRALGQMAQVGLQTNQMVLETLHPQVMAEAAVAMAPAHGVAPTPNVMTLAQALSMSLAAGNIGAVAANLGLAAPGTSPAALAALGLNAQSLAMAIAAPFGRGALDSVGRLTSAGVGDPDGPPGTPPPSDDAPGMCSPAPADEGQAP